MTRDELRKQLQVLMKEASPIAKLQKKSVFEVVAPVCFPQGLPPLPVVGPHSQIWRKPSPVLNAR